MWEKDINIHEVREIRSRTTVFFGVGAIAKIDDNTMLANAAPSCKPLFVLFINSPNSLKFYLIISSFTLNCNIYLDICEKM